MRLTKHLTLDSGREMIVRELTVTEIRELIRAEPADLVDAFVLDGVTLTELARLTDQPLDTLAALPPSQLDKVVAAAREVNPGFFGLKARVAQLVPPA